MLRACDRPSTNSFPLARTVLGELVVQGRAAQHHQPRDVRLIIHHRLAPPIELLVLCGCMHAQAKV
jgi:hypothetical protein